MSYLILVLVLGGLGGAYLYWPAYRLGLSLALGLSYFLWGVLVHKNQLHWQIVLEYFSLALLGVSLLIFMGLRA